MVNRVDDLPVAVKGDDHHAYYSSVHSSFQHNCAIDQDAQSHCSWARVAIHKHSSYSHCVSDCHHHTGDQFKGRICLKTGHSKVGRVTMTVDIRRCSSIELAKYNLYINTWIKVNTKLPENARCSTGSLWTALKVDTRQRLVFGR